jgi:DNA invertase Pin-like site-specific DNA recombinase
MSPKRKSLRLVGYVRVSRVAGREGDSFISPKQQRETIEAWARSQTPPHEVTFLEPDLDQSGGKLDRPSMALALEMVEDGYDGIIAAKLDRLTRSVADLGNLLTRAERNKWHLIAVDVGLDSSTSNGRLIWNVLASVAQWERDRRSEGWQEAHADRIARGIPSGSKVPAGYVREVLGEDRNGKPKLGKLLPDPKLARIVATAFKMRAGGEPWAGILEHVRRNRVTAWNSEVAVMRALRNRVYLGEIHYGGVEKIDPETGETYVTREHVELGAHEAIIDPGTFAAANRRESHTRNGNRDHLLGGILKCGTCGGPLSANPSTPRGSKGTVYVTYQCKSNPDCKARASISAGKVEPYVEEELFTYFETGEWQNVDRPNVPALNAAIEAAHAKLLKFEEDYDPDDESHKRILARLKREHVEAQTARAEATAAGYPTPGRTGISQLAQLAPDAVRTLWPEIPVAERREIIATALPGFTVAPGKGSVEERVRLG